jgi:hypothetical protein
LLELLGFTPTLDELQTIVADVRKMMATDYPEAGTQIETLQLKVLRIRTATLAQASHLTQQIADVERASDAIVTALDRARATVTKEATQRACAQDIMERVTKDLGTLVAALREVQAPVPAAEAIVQSVEAVRALLDDAGPTTQLRLDRNLLLEKYETLKAHSQAQRQVILDNEAAAAAALAEVREKCQREHGDASAAQLADLRKALELAETGRATLKLENATLVEGLSAAQATAASIRSSSDAQIADLKAQLERLQLSSQHQLRDAQQQLADAQRQASNAATQHQQALQQAQDAADSSLQQLREQLEASQAALEGSMANAATCVGEDLTMVTVADLPGRLAAFFPEASNEHRWLQHLFKRVARFPVVPVTHQQALQSILQTLLAPAAPPTADELVAYALDVSEAMPTANTSATSLIALGASTPVPSFAAPSSSLLVARPRQLPAPALPAAAPAPPPSEATLAPPGSINSAASAPLAPPPSEAALAPSDRNNNAAKDAPNA